MNLKNKRHLYHLVDSSPWPFVSSISVLCCLGGLIGYMNRVEFSLFLFIFGIIILGLTMYVWWRDVVRESLWQGNHTKIVQRGLRIGFILFLISEVMFFSGFFWGFFHSSLSVSIVLGGVWPPVGLIPLNPFSIPLLNTVILLLSGASITWSHYSIIIGSYDNSRLSFVITLFLAFLFTSLQISEYLNAPFSLSDSVYGSTFYSLTGLHGVHVIIGSLFIFVCFLRLIRKHFSTTHHLGFEFASWYWHFVDVVWLFLYLFVYIWGSW